MGWAQIHKMAIAITGGTEDSSTASKTGSFAVDMFKGVGLEIPAARDQLCVRKEISL